MLYRLRFDYYKPEKYERLKQPGNNAGPHEFAVHTDYLIPTSRRSQTVLGIIDAGMLAALPRFRTETGAVSVKTIKGQTQVSYKKNGDYELPFILIAEPVKEGKIADEFRCPQKAIECIESLYTGVIPTKPATIHAKKRAALRLVPAA